MVPRRFKLKVRPAEANLCLTSRTLITPLDLNRHLACHGCLLQQRPEILRLVLNPPAGGGSDQQMRMGRALESVEVEDIGFTLGDGDHLNLSREQLLGLAQGGEPALTFLLCRLAPMALVLKANSLRVTRPHLVMKQPQRETIGRESESGVQLEAMAKGGAADRAKVRWCWVMGEVKGGGVLNDENGGVLPATLTGSLGVWLQDRKGGDMLRVPEAVGSFGSSPGASSLRHTDSRLSTELSDQGSQPTSEAAISKVCGLKLMKSPLRCVWKSVKKCHTVVSVLTPV
jgi:hypothetical protein